MLLSSWAKAAASIPLNIGEGNERRGADRVHHFRIAAGSAAETVMALRVAQAWGHADAEPAFTIRSC